MTPKVKTYPNGWTALLYEACGWYCASVRDARIYELELILSRDQANTFALADALRWALDQLDDDLDLEHRAALDAARAVLARVEGTP